MIPTTQQLAMIGGKAASDNMRSIISGLSVYGARAGLDLPHRVTHYVAQLAHESMAFKYDQEIASGKAYEGRKDLGNIHPGDGVKFKGRTPGQITGRDNYRKFTAWARSKGLNPPDFEEQPELLNTDPWEGLGPIWFWETRKLNRYADANDIEMITQTWNGGLNGFDDRLKYYTRAGLVFLGMTPTSVITFQRWAQEQKLLPANTDTSKMDDGIPGPKTRSAIHMALVKLGGRKADDAPVVPAPVVTVEPTIPEGADKPGLGRWFSSLPLIGTPLMAFGSFDTVTKIIIGVLVVGGIVALLWRGEQIAQRARKIVAEFG